MPHNRPDRVLAYEGDLEAAVLARASAAAAARDSDPAGLNEFPSEADLRQVNAPASRGAVYFVAVETGATDVGLLSADEAANAFLSEGVPAESVETAVRAMSGAKAVVASARPAAQRPTARGSAVAVAVLAAGVVAGVGLISLAMPFSENGAEDAEARFIIQSMANAAVISSPSYISERPLASLPQAPLASVRQPAPRPASEFASARAPEASPVPAALRQQPATNTSTTTTARVETPSLAAATVEDIAATPVPEPMAAPRTPEVLSAVALNRVNAVGESRPAVAAAPTLERTTAPVTASTHAAPVRDLLTRYRAAYESLDARSAKQIWPAVDERALARAFDGLDSQTITFDACDLVVTETRASASCRGSASYVTRVGSRNVHTPSRQWDFQLQKAADQWVIASVQAR